MSVDQYIATQPEPTRGVLGGGRSTIPKAVPRVAEVISRQLSTYELDGHAAQPRRRDHVERLIKQSLAPNVLGPRSALSFAQSRP